MFPCQAPTTSSTTLACHRLKSPICGNLWMVKGSIVTRFFPDRAPEASLSWERADRRSSSSGPPGPPPPPPSPGLPRVGRFSGVIAGSRWRGGRSPEPLPSPRPRPRSPPWPPRFGSLPPPGALPCGGMPAPAPPEAAPEPTPAAPVAPPAVAQGLIKHVAPFASSVAVACKKGTACAEGTGEMSPD